jgi:membrane protein
MHKKRTKLSYYFRKYFILPFKIFRIAIFDTIKQDGVEHAGYLAFLSILALFPSLIFLISIIGYFGASGIGIKVLQASLSVVPKEMADALAPRIIEIIVGPPQSFLTIAIIGVIWTASSSVEGCRTILNRAYRIAFPPPYLLRRLLSILEFFAIVFSVIAGIFIFVIAPMILKVLKDKFNFHPQFDHNFLYLNKLAGFWLLVCATSTLYYILPNAKQKITQTVPGSIIVVALWTLLQKLFFLYLDNFQQFNLIYGSLAGVIISLMFFYLISLVFIFGAEFNYHFHRTYQIFLKERKKKNSKKKVG